MPIERRLLYLKSLPLKFTKMVAAGNDFIIFNGFEYNIKDCKNLALKACDRHFGIGADGILICKESHRADIQMLYYNSDGSQGEMCGNGIRCFSKYAYEKGLVKNRCFTVETLAGIKTVWLKVDENNKVKSVKVSMGKPVFNTEHIPVKLNKKNAIDEKMEIDGEEIVFSTVLIGVPHTVIFVDNIEDVDINGLGAKIENHHLFPKKTNVNFVKVISREEIKVYTWERGAGRTLGCGTGACASVVVGNVLDKLDKRVRVKTEGGELEVIIEKRYEIFLEGEASKVCDGVLYNIDSSIVDY